MLTLLFAGLLCRAELLLWLAGLPGECGHGAPCYRGLGVSYWRARLTDWRIDGGERPETAAERLQEKEERRRGTIFTMVFGYGDAGQWCLHHRETAGLVAYRKLRELQNDFHNRMAGTNVGIVCNPTYGEPFCKLEILDGDPAGVPVLTALLKDRDVHIRRVAAFALLRIRRQAQKAIPALLEVAKQDEDPFLRGIARTVACKIHRAAAHKAGIAEDFIFCSPQPELRAAVQGRFFLDSPNWMLAAGMILAWDEKGRAIELVDIPSGKVLLTFPGRLGAGSNIAFSPEGRTVASTSQDRRAIYVSELATGKRVGLLRGRFDAPPSLMFSRDGKTLAVASKHNAVTLWEVGAGKPLISLQGHTGGILSLAFSPDGKTLASGSADCTVKLWNLPAGKERASLPHQAVWGPVRRLAFSPDGKILATGSDDWTVKLWDVATRKERATCQGYDDEAEVDSLGFSPDGQTLASVQGGTIFVWDVATGKKIAKILADPSFVHSVGFDPNGRMLAVGGTCDRDQLKYQKLWQFPPGGLPLSR